MPSAPELLGDLLQLVRDGHLGCVGVLATRVYMQLLDLLAAQADEKYRRAAIDFSQNWMFGSLGPFLAMVKR